MKKTFILFAFLLPLLNIAQSNKASRIDSLMVAVYNSGAFNGNVLAAENGKVIYQKSFGLANEKTQKKLTLNSVFELASVSKQFTAMGIVQLQKEGKLSYEDPLGKYIPELAFYKDITIKHLLIHTAGLPDYMELMEKEWDKSKIADNEDVIKLYAKLKPAILFEPNAKWEYSNTGYLLLGAIIERVSGKSFGDYLNAKIFKPLGMKNTYVYRRRFKPEVKTDYAQGYIYNDSLQRKILPDDMGKESYAVYLDGIVGDGMVNSNLEDLLKWDRALYTDKLVNAKEKELLFSSYKTNSGDTEYGFGWMVWQSRVYGKIVSHSGGWAGYITYIERDLDNDKTILLLQNNATPKTINPSKDIRKILYSQRIDRPVVLNAEILRSYAGKYLDKSTEKEILFLEGKLYVVLAPGDNLELLPVSKTRFIVQGFWPEVSYEFIQDSTGKTIQYRAQQPEQGIDKTAIKVK